MHPSLTIYNYAPGWWMVWNASQANPFERVGGVIGYALANRDSVGLGPSPTQALIEYLGKVQAY